MKKPVPKTGSDGKSDSYFDEGEIYQIMADGEEARKKLEEKLKKKKKCRATTRTG